MGLADRLALIVSRTTDHFGEGYTVELLKRNTLAGSKLKDGGGSPALRTPIASAGITTLTLTSSATLSGVLYSGSLISIAGDATAYRTSADATPDRQQSNHYLLSSSPAVHHDGPCSHDRKSSSLHLHGCRWKHQGRGSKGTPANQPSETLPLPGQRSH